MGRRNSRPVEVEAEAESSVSGSKGSIRKRPVWALIVKRIIQLMLLIFY